MMRARYSQTFMKDGEEIVGPTIEIDLPFTRTSARALILRRSDGAIVGALHSPGGRFALPGGAIDDGETPAEAVLRELEEENIQLYKSDDRWQDRIEASYFDGYRELAIWYLFVVEDATLGDCEENIEVRWIPQSEDLWHPLMHKRILLALERYLPELIKVVLEVK